MQIPQVFDVTSIDLPKFAESLGLATTPRVRFLDRQNKLKSKVVRKDEKVVKTEQGKAPPPNEAEEEDVGKQTQEDLEDQGFGNLAKDGDDEDEDIFTVKRRDHKIDVDEDSEIASELETLEDGSKKSKQVLTKAQVAKKLLKKKIKANLKINFDEDGEAVDDSSKQKASVAGKQYEDDVEERLGGGIDITKAKEIMSEEDKFDKKAEKARIKEKHREEKRKKKEENRRLSKAARGEKDEDGEDEEEEGSEPDLSWLPDPDVLYGKEGDGEESEEKEESPVEEEVVVKEGKRKKTIIKKIIPKKPRLEEEEEESFKLDTGLSLGDDEDLAMQLLRR